MADRNQTLGTIFTAETKGLREAIREVTSLINKYATAVRQLQTGVSGLNQELVKSNNSFKDAGKYIETEYVKAIGKAATESGNYIKSLSSMTEGTTRQATALVVTKKALDAVNISAEKRALSIRSLNELGDRGNTIADMFLKNLDREAIARMKATMELQKYSGAAKKVWEETEKGTKTLTDYEKAQAFAAKQSAQYQKSFGELVNLYGKEGIALKESVKALNAVESVTQKRVATIKSMNSLGENATRVGDAFNESLNRTKIVQQALQSGTTNYNKEVGRLIDEQVRAMGVQLKTGEGYSWVGKQIGAVNGALNRLTAAFKVTAAYGIAGTAVYQLANVFKIGTKEIIDFDQSLKSVQAITGATDIEISALTQTIKQVAIDTRFSTTEVAQGVILLGQAGLTATESMSAIRGVTSLATATLSDFKFTADLVTTTLRAFNLNATETERVTDVMANAMNKSKLDLDKLRTAFNYVGAAAYQGGLSLEQVAASMMVLSNAGMRASTIGTGLRQVLSRMLAPNRQLREAFEAHGIALDKVNPKTVGWEGALKALLPIIWDSEKGVVDMGKAYALFGLRGAQAIAVLTSAFVSGDYHQMLESTYELGSSATMAQKQLEGLGSMIKNLTDRFKVLALGIGDAGALGMMKKFIGGLQDLTEWLIEATESGIGKFGKEIIVLTGLITALLIPFAFIIAKLVSFIATMRIAILAVESFNAAMVLLGKHPIATALALASVLAILIATVREFTNANKELIEQTGQAAMKNIQAAESLRTYAKGFEEMHKSIGKGEDIRDRYEASIKRLLKDHPDLAKTIDITKISHEELIKAINELTIAKEAEATNKYKERLGALSEEFSKVTNKAQVYNTVQNILNEQTDNSNTKVENLIKSNKEVGRVYNDIIETLRGYASIMIPYIKNKELEIEAAEKLIDSIVEEKGIRKEAGEETKKWMKITVESLSMVQALQDELNQETIRQLEEMPYKMKAVFSQLSDIEKAHFVDSYERMQKQIAAFKETATLINERMTGTYIDIAAGVAAIEEEATNNLIEQLKRRERAQIKSATESYENRIKTVQIAADKEIQILDEMLARGEISEKEHAIRKEIIESDTAVKIIELREMILDKAQEIARHEVDAVEDAANKKFEAEKRLAAARIDLEKVMRVDNEKERDIALKNLSISLDKEKFAVEKSVNDKWRTEADAKEKLLKLEKDDAEARYWVQKKYFEDVEHLEDTDQQKYLNALQAKQDAEHDFYRAKKALDDERLKNTQENIDEEKKKVEELKRSWEDVKITLSTPIKVDIDTTPAEAALDYLKQKYNDMIAGLMASQAEFMAGLSAGNIGSWYSQMMAEAYQTSIAKYEATLSRIETAFKLEKFQTGGYVENNAGIAEKGEYVIKESIVSKIGRRFFDWLNTLPASITSMPMKGIDNGADILKQIFGVTGPQVAFAMRGATNAMAGGVGGTSGNYNYSDTYNNTFNISGGNQNPKQIATEVDRILSKKASYNRSSFYNQVKKK